MNARIEEVWVGCLDPHPKVGGDGFQYLKDNGVSVHFFSRDLQEVIENENKDFFRQAEAAAAMKQKETPKTLSEFKRASPTASMDQFSPDAMDRYRSRLMRKAEHTEKEFHQRLEAQGLLENGEEGLQPTGFGMLLFAKNPRDTMVQAGVLGTISVNSEDDVKDFDGPMVSAPEQAINWLKNKLPNPISRSEAQRKEQNELYYELVREGLVNALVHRDYSIQQAKVQLVVTPEKTVIRSPGEPMPPVTLEQLQNFTAPMFSRNPRLHAVFNIMELAEERGLGLRSMKERAQKAGLPLPRYVWSDPYLDLTIYQSAESATAVLDDAIRSVLGESELAGWQWFSTQSSCSSREYAEHLKIEARSARRHLNHFVELGLAQKTGSGPSTSYHRL